MAIKKIDFTEAKQILDTKPDCIIVDVREEEEYITGHAVGALLFPVDEINDVSAMMLIPDKDRPYILYCRSGRRSADPLPTIPPAASRQTPSASATASPASGVSRPDAPSRRACPSAQLTP